MQSYQSVIKYIGNSKASPRGALRQPVTSPTPAPQQSRPGTAMTKKPESKAVHRKTASFQPVAKGARPSTNNAETAAPVLTVSSKKPAHKRQASGKTTRTLTEKPVSNTQQSRQPLFQPRREKDVANAKQQAML